ncbi:GntP family permease [Oceanobacillus timonensis]|uniref:GntP family permease n=1 Tax=Oceanobacillus timonensis TaxID=1926285 RepID=UPI0009BBEFE8|nr:SLC13 family permease [Oceanobacillus timonensis]
MSTIYVLSVLAIVIIAMIFLISVVNLHPVISLLFAAIALGIGLKVPWEDLEGVINSGFASTIEDVAIVIVLGSILGKVLEETGAARKLTNSTVKLVGEKRVIWAIGISSLILGIPIFADTVVILLIPVVSVLAQKTKKSMISYGSALYVGALVTSSLIPPTPGPIAAASLLNVPLSEVIIWGTVVAVPSVLAAVAYCNTLKEEVQPKEEYLISNNDDNQEKLPKLTSSLAPIFLPLVLIVGNTVINALYPDSFIANFFAFIGSPLAALLSGCILSLILTGQKWKSKTVLNDWVESSLGAAAMPIVVTGMGGALAEFIKQTGVADNIGSIVGDTNFPGILIPIIIAALIHIITGSNTLGVMTTAALVAPMLNGLGISPLVALLGCGAGALMFKHTNSSGFWVTVSLSNMNVKQGIKGVSVSSTIAGFVGAIITSILHYSGII